jgi:hypothetical protein
MNRISNITLGLISAAVFGWLSFSVEGCGSKPPIEAACDKACKCLGSQCQETFVDECVTATEAERDDAVAKGCEGQFDDYFACLGGDGVPCQASQNPCQAEQDAFAACGATDPEVCKSSIERIGGALDDCGVDSSGVRGTVCTDESAHLLKCQEPCYQDATCEAISGMDPEGGKTFNDCLAACDG